MSEFSSLSHVAGAEGRRSVEEMNFQLETERLELTISEMSRLHNVTLRALRFYEERGLIKPRREGKARLYCAADQVRLTIILGSDALLMTLVT